MPIGFSTIKSAVFEIGSWNMSGSPTQVIDTTIPPSSIPKVVSISAMIMLDGTNSSREFTIETDSSTTSGGWFEIRESGGVFQILMNRNYGGIYINGYNDTSINRGYVTISYIE